MSFSLVCFIKILPTKFSTLFFPYSIQNEAVDVDIDEILDMDTDATRRSHLYVSFIHFLHSVCNKIKIDELYSHFGNFIFTEHFIKFKLQAFRKGYIRKLENNF